MRIKNITYGGLLLAIGILLPQVFHLTGIPQSGAVFLPMHIPVLLAGFLLGPLYGAGIGIILPVISFLLTGMPPADRLLFMVGELFTYGLVSGLLYYNLKFVKKKLGIYATLILSLAAGRVVYAIMLTIAANLLHIPCGGALAAVSATVMGIYGIIIQLILVPAIVYALKKGGLLNGING